MPESVALFLQYNDLMRKKRIVENDKAKIEKVIHELDEKKKEALRQAWEQVRWTLPWSSFVSAFLYCIVLV